MKITISWKVGDKVTQIIVEKPVKPDEVIEVCLYDSVTRYIRKTLIYEVIQ